MRLLLTPLGSSGDVHPYVGIGRELRARGHEVVLIAAEPHRGVVERAGVEFVSVVTREEYDAAVLDPDLWHPRRGLQLALKLVATGLERLWSAIEARHEPGRTLLVGHPLAFATRSFEEKHGARAVTLQLAPSSLRSLHQVPAVAPGVDISGWPRWLKRLAWIAIDRLLIDPAIAPALNRWRATHGLAPVRRIFRSWFSSPHGVVGLFPAWFGARQPDWPDRFDHASFPLWDDPASGAVDPTLDAFLAAGTAPIVFSPGSANRQAAAFFAAAAAALAQMERRGLFLTAYPEQLPAGLPDTILHRAYAPFSRVVPRAAALVHHGGIGTLAQGLAAGVPQLVMPMGFDQPDNAMRAARLGVARWLVPKEFTAGKVARNLDELLQSASVREAVDDVRERLRAENGIARTCDLLERALPR